MSIPQKKGILLLNLGTPVSPETADVRKYLLEFLMDGRVIDIPVFQRTLLVKGIIAPFRAPKSAAQYKEIWTKEGSPLLVHSRNLAKKLQQKMGNDFVVELGMRYQQPTIQSAMDTIMKNGGIGKLVIVPLYPQYSASATSSSVDKTVELLRNMDTIPSFVFMGPFYNNPHFINSFATIWKKKYKFEEYDHFLFSYHGLPERHIMKASNEKKMGCNLGECCNTISGQNYYCYRGSCYHTTRLLVKALGLKEGSYSTSFQSRLGKDPWIKPYTDQTIIEKAKSGIKKMLVFSPAFVADCLETLFEVKVEYARLFKEHGGETLHLAESLNDNDEWVEALEKIILTNITPNP